MLSSGKGDTLSEEYIIGQDTPNSVTSEASERYHTVTTSKRLNLNAERLMNQPFIKL